MSNHTEELKSEGYKLVLENYYDKNIPLQIWAKSQDKGLGVDYYFVTRGHIVGSKQSICKEQLELFQALGKIMK